MSVFILKRERAQILFILYKESLLYRNSIEQNRILHRKYAVYMSLLYFTNSFGAQTCD